MSREIFEKIAHVFLNIGVLFLLFVFYRYAVDILGNKLGDKWLTIVYFQTGIAISIIAPAYVLLRVNKTISDKMISIFKFSEVYIPIMILLISFVLAGLLDGFQNG